MKLPSFKGQSIGEYPVILVLLGIGCFSAFMLVEDLYNVDSANVGNLSVADITFFSAISNSPLPLLVIVTAVLLSVVLVLAGLAEHR